MNHNLVAKKIGNMGKQLLLDVVNVSEQYKLD